MAEPVDERLARRGRLGALVEFGLPERDAGLVCDGAASTMSSERQRRARADRRDGEAAGDSSPTRMATYMTERVPSRLSMFS